MPESTIEPNPIKIDTIKKGKARLICRWNITEETRTEELGDDSTPQMIYVYDEVWIGWAIPAQFDVNGDTVYIPEPGDATGIRSYVELYVNSNSDEIMNYAMATTRNA